MSSPRTARRLNRILAMLPWVIANPGATVEEVCTRFDYTPRQLAADLDLVFVCGLPGYGPGDLMVAYIDEDEVVVEMADYFAQPLRLTAPEALSLLAAGMAVLSSGQAPAALERAVDKLRGAVLPDDPEALVVDLSEPELVGTLRDAAAEGTVVSITYTGLASGATTTREIEPWSVFSTLGNWYVRAHCRLADAERVFRVDRIQAAEETAVRFDPPASLPPPVVEYTPSEGDVRAVIRLGPRARWVAEYYPVETVADGEDLVVRFSAQDASVTARLLLRLGPDAALLEGEEVAAELADLRARIGTRYGQ
ncbi:MAG: WYL domain-containing protein [Acidimicrobiia bacterium]|nr:WYL domain-containing protein [Acidimicrobiia bacterium]